MRVGALQTPVFLWSYFTVEFVEQSLWSSAKHPPYALFLVYCEEVFSSGADMGQPRWHAVMCRPPSTSNLHVNDVIDFEETKRIVSIQIKFWLHYCVPHNKFFKTRSHVDIFRQNFINEHLSYEDIIFFQW
jgi:hypothetical protein